MLNELIIVSGLPRSGTSLMMQILKAGGIEIVTDGRRIADSYNPAGYFEDLRVKQLQMENRWLLEQKGKAVKIISHLLPYIPLGLPVKVIFVLRDLDEVIISQNRMLKINADGNQIEDIKRKYDSHLLEMFKWMDNQKSLKYIKICYGDILKNPTGQIQILDNFLNNLLNVSLAAKAVTPDLYRSKK